MIDAYPLSWPIGWERTHPNQRVRANFSKQIIRSFAVVRDELLNELKLLGAHRDSVVISSNVPLRRDGLPYSGMRQPDDVGVAIYFELGGEQRCFPCDRWDRVEDNLRAISLSINAMRGLERWGAKQMVDAAFTGFAALPDGSGGVLAKVLGVDPTMPRPEVERAYRTWAKQHHPDVGGNADLFREVTAAYQDATRTS